MAQGAALGLFVFPCPATFFPSELCNGRSRRTWPFRRPSVFHLDDAERMIEAIADRYRLLLIRLGAVRDARDSASARLPPNDSFGRVRRPPLWIIHLRESLWPRSQSVP